MYTLYIANKNYSSWSLRPWVLLREAGIDFTEQLVVFDPLSNRARFRQFAPNAKVPCLVDGGTTVWDSLAIIEYVAERHPAIWPAEAGARAWARCAAAEMHSGFTELRERCSMNCGIRVQLHEIDAGLQRDLDRIGELWSEGLARFGGPFLAGAQFGAVDAYFAPVAFRIQTYGLLVAPPSAAAYAQRLLQLDAMRQWYAAALAEPWRDPEHEAETRRYGRVQQDLRGAAAAA